MPLPIPEGRQREVVCLPATGHQVILGTAGSGKTTMAILRAAYLSDPELPEHGRTLLVTFNKSLGGYIRAVGGLHTARVRVENYHKFARGYLSSKGLIDRNDIVSPTPRRNLIDQAVQNIAAKASSPLFARPISFFEAEVEWLAKHGIVSANDYRAQERVGRAQARLERNLRAPMWSVYEEYLKLRTDAGYRYDWDDLASAVCEALEADHSPRMYKHIVIDEGQDLSPEVLRSLTLAVPAVGSISFFGDVAQQIYGRRMSWRSAGLRPRQIWEFSHNYRNSQEISALGLAIAEMPYYADVPDMVQPEAPRAAGPKPTLVRVGRATNEVAFVADQAARLARTSSVAVLVRTVAQLGSLISSLPNGSANLRDENLRWIAGPRLLVGTYHSAKGLEFDTVILPFLSDAEFPDPNHVQDFGLDEAMAEDGRLLYVGVTRARRSLILTYQGTVTPMLPTDVGLYTAVTR